MSRPKIIKAVAATCNLKDETCARVRDSKFNQLEYYEGEIELVKCKIDHVHTNTTKFDHECGHSLREIEEHELQIYDSEIDTLVQDGSEVSLYRGAEISDLCINKSSTNIKGEAHVKHAVVTVRGGLYVAHGYVQKANVWGWLTTCERGIINFAEIQKGGKFMSGYRYTARVSVPVVHQLLARSGSSVKFRGDCAVGELRIAKDVKVEIQSGSMLFLGRLYIDGKQITKDLTAWIDSHTHPYA